ncbi:hypothetical protein SCATT_17990 [Streptantibioticus cattleyicolor NRRL 8057 = DSM 46488]|uniref:DUF4328 domain-containing protein n=1 Tax=Streptantibioticus cattleyicolor (strain ATCC 35852 / DSM 46488 / JCM 4925 / NBRC 14057 / NRRL 8057) TaxID=1003195 RepID=G8WQB0_STREN|nr:hypothetical protein SCATT_17990 [Streptantibioticus cattleyicolor NRRL 8057 = DSM 46488]MYS58833.1 DUF4328 domain-containing protein [Streptomyces sp. SID5468]
MAGAATTATILISLALVHEALLTVANWRLYFLAHDYLAGKATAADLEAADNDALATLGSLWPSMLIWIAAGIAVLVWLWRARINSELMSDAAAHRRSRGWVVGAWATPVANLWIPYQVVSDVWRASAPRRSVPVTLINAWWALFVVANVVVRPIQWRMSSKFDSVQDVLSDANVTTLLTALYVAAGLLLVLIIRRITAWQTHKHAQNAV